MLSSVGESTLDSEPANALEFGEADCHSGTKSPGFCRDGSGSGLAVVLVGLGAGSHVFTCACGIQG